ncbi:hypothetical protein F0562_010761 [Nyssa sinensis]|uniref:P-type ATPase C-terminal domain-containing protein n=1 Tax=Nyssa sinensis TaxID=561372 RepID=A0A5J5A2W3_9ASTE|nr:hypothetical protein F0562_010761 [Nyssa sinensis]
MIISIMSDEDDRDSDDGWDHGVSTQEEPESEEDVDMGVARDQRAVLRKGSVTEVGVDLPLQPYTDNNTATGVEAGEEVCRTLVLGEEACRTLVLGEEVVHSDGEVLMCAPLAILTPSGRQIVQVNEQWNRGAKISTWLLRKIGRVSRKVGVSCHGFETDSRAAVVFLITIHAYAHEKSEMEEVSMVALSGCIWLQAFVVALETNSFTILQHLAIWGNLVAFYVINWIVSALPSSGMYTIMFRLCRQPSYWITVFLIVVAGMGPVLALKYFRYTYRPSKINILQQAERLGGPIMSLGNIEPQPRSLEKDISPLSITIPKNRNPAVYEPLLSDSPNSTRRSFGGGTTFDFFQSQSRLSLNYSRNCKDN